MASKNVKEMRTLDWKFWVAITLILAVGIFVAYQLGAFKKTCNDDKCFKEALDGCKYAKQLATKNLNYYLYTIKGKSNGDCKVDVELMKMATGTPPEKVKQFEGKWMQCSIPRTEIAKMNTFEFEGMLTYCTGPLKESMYQLIIEKLYGIIIKNMGSVIGAVEDTLKGEV